MVSEKWFLDVLSSTFLIYIFFVLFVCDCSHLVQNDLDLIILSVWFSYIYIKLLEILGSCYKCLEKMIQVSTIKIIWSNLFFIYAGNNCNPSNEGTKFSMTLMKKWKFCDSRLQINGYLWINSVGRSQISMGIVLSFGPLQNRELPSSPWLTINLFPFICFFIYYSKTNFPSSWRFLKKNKLI